MAVSDGMARCGRQCNRPKMYGGSACQLRGRGPRHLEMWPEILAVSAVPRPRASRTRPCAPGRQAGRQAGRHSCAGWPLSRPRPPRAAAHSSLHFMGATFCTCAMAGPCYLACRLAPLAGRCESRAGLAGPASKPQRLRPHPSRSQNLSKPQKSRNPTFRVKQGRRISEKKS